MKTGAGVSEVSYKIEEGQLQLTGELQGKADVPTLFCQQSLVLLHAHNEITRTYSSIAAPRSVALPTIISRTQIKMTVIYQPHTAMMTGSDAWWPGWETAG